MREHYCHIVTTPLLIEYVKSNIDIRIKTNMRSGHFRENTYWQLSSGEAARNKLVKHDSS